MFGSMITWSETLTRNNVLEWEVGVAETTKSIETDKVLSMNYGVYLATLQETGANSLIQ